MQFVLESKDLEKVTECSRTIEMRFIFYSTCVFIKHVDFHTSFNLHAFVECVKIYTSNAIIFLNFDSFTHMALDEAFEREILFWSPRLWMSAFEVH